MHNSRSNNKKGIVLFIVLATIFIVILLGNIILNIMSSQSRLTHHQVSRIQAYYAAMAGVNYAFDKLRRADWQLPTPGNFYTQNLNDPAFPASIQNQNVEIVVAARNANANVPGCNPCNPPSGVDICICSTTTYTYTP